MHRAALVILDVSSALIVCGGLYDLLTPRLPANLIERCGHNEAAQEWVRALLRALGGCLIAIGIAAGVLAKGPVRQGQGWSLALILALVLPAEGLNALGMRRVGSPFYVPLAFMPLTVAGVGMAAAGPL